MCYCRISGICTWSRSLPLGYKEPSGRKQISCLYTTELRWMLSVFGIPMCGGHWPALSCYSTLVPLVLLWLYLRPESSEERIIQDNALDTHVSIDQHDCPQGHTHLKPYSPMLMHKIHHSSQHTYTNLHTHTHPHTHPSPPKHPCLRQLDWWIEGWNFWCSSQSNRVAITQTSYQSGPGPCGAGTRAGHTLPQTWHAAPVWTNRTCGWVLEHISKLEDILAKTTQTLEDESAPCLLFVLCLFIVKRMCALVRGKYIHM